MPKLVRNPEGAVNAVPTSFELPAGWVELTPAEAATAAAPEAPGHAVAAQLPAEQEAAALEAAAHVLEEQAAAVEQPQTPAEQPPAG